MAGTIQRHISGANYSVLDTTNWTGAISLSSLGAAPASHSHANLTKFFPGDVSDVQNINDVKVNAIKYVQGSVLGQSDGGVFSQFYGATWGGQIFQDYRTGKLAVRRDE